MECLWSKGKRSRACPAQQPSPFVAGSLNYQRPFDRLRANGVLVGTILDYVPHPSTFRTMLSATMRMSPSGW